MNSALKETLPLDKEHWDMIIEPKRNLLDLRLVNCGGRATW